MDVQDIVIKHTQPVRVAQATATGLTHADIGPAFGQLMPQVIAYLESVGARRGISVASYEDEGGTAPEGEIVLHAGFEIGGQDVPGTETVRVIDLPVVEVAAAVYRGGDEGIVPAWKPSSAGSRTAATGSWAIAGSSTTSGTTTTRHATSPSSSNRSGGDRSLGAPAANPRAAELTVRGTRGHDDAVVDEDVRRQQRDLVRRGYDVISERYRDDHGAPNPVTAEAVKPYGAWLDELAGLLPAGARVLDLGCGSGLPASRMLVERGFAVTGVDISRVQVDRARRLVPQARFVQADMAEWVAEPASFDAIVNLYALIHVPIGDQLQLFPRMAAWLVPGGYLLAIVGTERWSGVEDYMGAPMFWDHADAGTYLDWFVGASLHPVWHRAVPEGSSSHTLVLARTPAAT
ncbi:MAG TPA: methyltransferase domain-containing protein [Acidimicrobiales bacterium]|nr:methyltransferase domain-containing protein [Acidimicrobiales bacterium]